MEACSMDGSHNAVAPGSRHPRAGPHREKRWRVQTDAGTRVSKKSRNLNEYPEEEQAGHEGSCLISLDVQSQGQDVGGHWNHYSPPPSELVMGQFNSQEGGASYGVHHRVAETIGREVSVHSSVKVFQHSHHQAPLDRDQAEWYGLPTKETVHVEASTGFSSSPPQDALPSGPSGSSLPASAPHSFAPYGHLETRPLSTTLSPSSTWSLEPGSRYAFAPTLDHSLVSSSSTPTLPHSLQHVHVGPYRDQIASTDSLLHHSKLQSPITASNSSSAEITPTYVSRQTYATTLPTHLFPYYENPGANVTPFTDQSVHATSYSGPQAEASSTFAPHYIPLTSALDSSTTSQLHSTIYDPGAVIEPILGYRYMSASSHESELQPLPEYSHVEPSEVIRSPNASTSIAQHLPNIPSPEQRRDEALPQFKPDTSDPEGNASFLDRVVPGSPDSDSESNERKRRRQFTEEKRRETSDTRAMGACVRCRMQKTRCLPNVKDPDDAKAPCQTCNDLLWTSKKIVHAIPCTRDKLTSITVYRAGKLRLTKRFTENEMVNINDCPGLNNTKVIYVSLGMCRQRIKFEVRRFTPTDTDVTYRDYMDTGVRQRQELAPYCLADIEKTAATFGDYFHKYAFDGLKDVVVSDPLVRETFDMIDRHYHSLPDKTETGKPNEEKKLLFNAVCLWFATRHTTGSATIEGSETLGMERPKNPNYPLKNSGISLPRMISAQCDSIQHSRIMKILKPSVLRQLEVVIRSRRMQCWFTIYLIMFLLLHQISHISIDRRRWAFDNALGMETYYGPRGGDYSDLTKFVEAMQESAWTLLVHWHYYKRTDLDLMNFDWERRQSKSVVCLGTEQVQFMKRSISLLRPKLNTISRTPAPECWDHELFFVSKMFGKKLDQLDTFNLN